MSTIDVCEMDDVLSIVVVGMCSNVVTIKIFPVKHCIIIILKIALCTSGRCFCASQLFIFLPFCCCFCLLMDFPFLFLGASLRNDGAQFPETKSSSSCCISLILPVMFL